MKIDQKGQTLVFILLISIVGLTLGLAMAGRSVSRVAQTKESEGYNRAFSSAETGLEDAALKIKENPDLLKQTFQVTNGSLAGSDATYSYTCTPSADQQTVDLAPISKDDVGQVNLVRDEATGSYTTGKLEVYWVKGADQQNTPASLVLSLITQGGTGDGCVDNYCIRKYAVNPYATARTNGFLGASSGGTSGYSSLYEILIPGGENAQLLRIRAMYNGGVPADVRVRAASSQLGFQYQECTATGTAGGNKAKEKFTISYPTLPAIFDYVLFSGSTTNPLTHQ